MGYIHYTLANVFSFSAYQSRKEEGAIDAFRIQRADARRTFLPLFSQVLLLPMLARSAILRVQLCPHQHG